MPRVRHGRHSPQTTCALEVIARENQLDAAKRRGVAPELPRHHLELVEELPADHGYLVDDEHLRAQSRRQANSMDAFSLGGGSGQGCHQDMAAQHDGAALRPCIEGFKAYKVLESSIFMYAMTNN